MSVTNIDKNFDDLTLTLTADFDAAVDRIWDLWADPRRLERWWGPPTYPATFERHDLKPGGEVVYFMTSPEGEKHYGWWKVNEIDPPNGLSFTDGFGDQEGKPSPKMPTTEAAMRLFEHEGRTRMELVSHFGDRAQMQQLDEMGMAEGLRQAVGQMDALLD